MKSITTRFLVPSNCRGNRVSAYDGDTKVIIKWDDDAHAVDNHKNAAATLCKKLGWTGTMNGGDCKAGMVWVFVDENDQFTV